MEAEGLSHLERRTRERISRFTGTVKELAGEDLVSVVLYGNAAREGFDPKTSAINVMIVLRKIEADFLAAYAKAARRFPEISTPLFFTPELIRTSLDIFPIEFLSLKESYIVLHGEDPLREIEVRIEDLRAEIEQQIKRNLIRMREEFIHSLDRKADLEHFLISCLMAFIPLFRNIMRLLNRECAVEGVLFREFCKETGLDERPFFAIWDIRTGRARFRKRELISLFGEFMREIETLAGRLDGIVPEGRVC